MVCLRGFQRVFVAGVVLGSLGGAADAQPDKAAEQSGWGALPPLQLKANVNDIWLLTFAPDGKTLAVASFGNQRDVAPVLRLVDVTAPKPRERHALTGHKKAAVALMAFASEGKTLVSVATDGTAKVWDVDAGKATSSFAVGKKDMDEPALESAWLTASGKTLVVFPMPRTAGGFGAAKPIPPRVELWDPLTGKLRRTVPLPPGQHGMALSPDGSTLVCGTGPADDLLPDSVAQERFWNLQSGKQDGALSVKMVARALYSPTGKHVVFQQINAETDVPGLVVWDVAKRKAASPKAEGLKQSHAHGFSADGKYLATASADKRKITVWELSSEKELGRVPPLDSWVAAAALSADGRTLAVVTDPDNALLIFAYKGSEADPR
jgi:WD40 repeat protein